MKRIVVVSGHYGSGKTEFAVNLALRQAGRDEKVALADLDVVNPYFRSREKRALLENAGVTVIGSSTGADSGADLPALSAQVHAPLQDPESRTILDVGGDAVGARLLGRYKHFLGPESSELFVVVNTSRPETRTVADLIAQIRAIEAASGLTATGLVNNSHMLEFTQVYHLEEGDAVCRETADELGIPVVFLSAREAILPRIPEELLGERLSIGMYLREAWMYA